MTTHNSSGALAHERKLRTRIHCKGILIEQGGGNQLAQPLQCAFATVVDLCPSV